jgi:hypothetical protein
LKLAEELDNLQEISSFVRHPPTTTTLRHYWIIRRPASSWTPDVSRHRWTAFWVLRLAQCLISITKPKGRRSIIRLRSHGTARGQLRHQARPGPLRRSLCKGCLTYFRYPLRQRGTAENLGTSFAPPLVARTLAQIYHQVSPVLAPPFNKPFTVKSLKIPICHFLAVQAS